jgi:ubiquinone/menaquinone biosynthesis C-methylase UbiE
MCPYYPESKVEISGLSARYYDTLMNIITVGGYSGLMQKAISLMSVKPTDRIIDLGAGTGTNALLMLKHLSSNGELIGLDISVEMIRQFRKKSASFANVKIVNQRIDIPLPYKQEFDKAFISFVLHGFPQEVRTIVIRNAFKALKEQGEFFILDYGEFSLKEIPFYMRIFFKAIECPYAFDFIERNWYRILTDEGFSHIEQHLFFDGYVRLLRAVKARELKGGQV